MTGKWAWFFSLILLVMPTPADPADDRDPLDAPRWTPYRFTDIHSWRTLDYHQRAWNRQAVASDIDGDGASEFLFASTVGTTFQIQVGDRPAPSWQEPNPIEFSRPDCPCAVDGIWVFDDPDHPEGVVKIQTPDRKRWYFERRRLPDGKLMAGFTLPGGPDTWADGAWDGNYMALGVMDVPADGDTVKALIILAEAGRDLQPRGVMAVRADTGERLWEYWVGPKPYWSNAHLVDLQGDGSPEIVFAGAAVDNIHGPTFNGTSDQVAMVFALDASGNLLWQREFGRYPANLNLAPAMFPTDGPDRLVVSTNNTHEPNSLLLLDGTGATLDELPLDQRVVHLQVHSNGIDPPLAAFSLFDGTLLTVDITPEGFTVRARTRLVGHPRVTGLEDLLAESGPELLVSFPTGPAWVFGADLTPLAYHEGDEFPPIPQSLIVLHDKDRQPYFLARGNEQWGGVRFSLEKNPRDIPWAALALVGAVGGLIPVWRWRRRRRDPSHATLRELKLQLLDRLKLSGHGAIGSLSSLRRFIWNLDALVQGFDVKAGERNIFGQLTQEILDVQLPNLESALELGELAKLDRDRLGKARAALDSLGTQLRELDRAGFPPDMLKASGPALREAGDLAERAFHNLRRLVEGAFRADTADIVMRVLEAHERSLAEAGITVRADLAGLPDAGMDPEELAFVLENLVGNAVRAMRGGEHPELVIGWSDSGSDVTITVQDTGCGIVPDDWQRIFEPGYSSRPGGGLGLPHSRDLLRKYSGSILVRDSRAGGGTTMAVILPLAADPPLN